METALLPDPTNHNQERTMIKIINKKRYDTSNATSVASTDNGRTPDDFRHQEETLYLTKNGSWFLHGQGGPLSPYGEQRGRNRTEGEDLRAMTADEAYAWLETSQKAEAISIYFCDHLTDA